MVQRVRGSLVRVSAMVLVLAPGEARGAAHNLAMDEMCPADLGDLSLTVDSYGAFGSSTTIMGDAFFDPPQPEWRRAGTVFESMAFLCTARGRTANGTWLETNQGGGGWGWDEPAGLPLGAVQANQVGNTVTSNFEFDDVEVELVQELNCNTLTQCYTFTNVGNALLTEVAITHYIDGDLYFVGGFTNDYGSYIAGPPRVVYEFDQGDDPLSPSTNIGLSSTDPRDPFLTSWELGEYSESRSRIASTSGGCTVLQNDMVDDQHRSTDRNGDQVTDSGYDVTLSLRFDVGPLPVGETTIRPLCIDIRWGVGLPCGDPDEDGICQQDDNCDFVFNPGQEDTDHDGVGDVCDNCPTDKNEDQDDRDFDGIGDACDKHFCTPTVDETEICDDKDNDCDGRVDNVPEQGLVCATGLPGACAQGSMRCLGGELICAPTNTEERLETCDLIDNDCDGQIDEDLINDCGTCGPKPIDICDNQDNDCDGQTAEDAVCPEEGQACILGRCRDQCEDNQCLSSGEPDPTTQCTDEGYCVPACDLIECPSDQVCYAHAGAGGEGPHCEDPCANIPCEAPNVCRLGACGSCHRVGCPEGQVCQDNACIADPCLGVPCGANEGCLDGTCFPSCAGISCPLYEECFEGTCQPAPCGGVVCPEGHGCKDGQCRPNPCGGIACEPGTICQGGVCHPHPCHRTTCPERQTCKIVCLEDGCHASCVADWMPDAPVVAEGEGEGEGEGAEGEGAEGEGAEGEGAEGEGAEGEGAEGEGEGAEGEGEGGAEGEGEEQQRRSSSCQLTSGSPSADLSLLLVGLLLLGLRRRG